MRITQLRLAGQAGRPELLVDRFSPELNVFFGQPGAGKSTVAQLAAHLLYGKTEPPRRAGRGQFGQNMPLAEGSIEVESPQGRYLLRRHRDSTPQGRLSIASSSGAAVESRTIRGLLSDISPRLLAELYAVDFAEPPQAATLLEGEFAREFTQSINPEIAGDNAVEAGQVCQQHALVTSTKVDRRRVDELIRRRDKVVREIEDQMSASRRESGALERQLREVEAALAARRQQAEELHARLLAADAKLAEIAATLRYFTLASTVRRGPAVDEEKQRAQIAGLDAEIARCRQTLSDLQLRDAAVRRETAELHPDGTADSASCLADQRATVGVLERLLDDLDAEVAQLARSHEPGRCIGCDSHARLSPVAQLLRQQLYTLCGQVTEQQRSVRRVQLQAEARQLARAQTDLSEQLEHLLQQRQSLVHESQLARRPAVLAPQTPAASHCQCTSHAEFVRSSTVMLIAGDGPRREEVARTRRVEMERDRDRLRAKADALQQEIETFEAHWRRLQHNRATSGSGVSLDQLRAELDQLEKDIQRTLQGARPTVTSSTAAAPHRQPWKASDVLAQLTDGQLMQIRIGRESHGATIIDRAGGALGVKELNPARQDQLYVALTLALASSLANRGIDLPLFLDEPFLRQDERGTAAMVGVLDEFARQGRQIIVFTEDRAAARRFESLGVEVRNLDELRRSAPLAKPVAAPAIVAGPAELTTVKIVREPIDQSKPELRVAREWSPADDDRDVYFLTLEASIADFPVLGNDTAKIFAALGIDSVAELLFADAADVATRLKRTTVTADTVRLWQSHMSLMSFVPGLSLNDAQVLAANEVTSPEALFTIDVRLLAESIERFLGAERGRRFASVRDRFTRDRLSELQKLARTQRERWLQMRDRFSWADRPVSVAPVIAARISEHPRRNVQAGSAAPAKARRAKQKPLRFLLGRNSPVAAAPSVGPRAVEHLATVGIRTVADLLNANPQSMSEELADGHITLALVTRWQNEARLACRIPELRSCGARLLVACGYSEPEQVAGANPVELAKAVKSLCGTPKGRRLLGHRKAPSAERVATWVRLAGKMRPLEAA